MIKTKIRDSYAVYKKKADNPVSLGDYVHITGEYNKFLMDIVFAGHRAKLPYRLGSLEIKGKRIKPRIDDKGNIKGLAPDWKKTKELWARDEESRLQKKIVYHTNSHTGNIRYRIKWSKRNMLGLHKWVYTFTLTRANKRHLAKLIKEGKEY